MSGLRATDDTLSITLRAPSGTFLARLSLPAFCPVPVGSARIRGGVNDPPLPRSGPFYVSDHVSGQYLILKRNPNYPGPRKTGADAIVWLTGIDPSDAISRLNAGTVDLVPTLEQLDPQGSIARQWGPGSDAARSGDQRYFSSDGGGRRIPVAQSPRPVAQGSGRPAGDRARPQSNRHGDELRARREQRAAPERRDRPAAERAVQARRRLRRGLRSTRRSGSWAGRTGSIVLSFWTGCDPCQRMATQMTPDLQAIGIGLTVEDHDDPNAAAAKSGSDISMVIGFVQPLVSGQRRDAGRPSGCRAARLARRGVRRRRSSPSTALPIPSGRRLPAPSSTGSSGPRSASSRSGWAGGRRSSDRASVARCSRRAYGGSISSRSARRADGGCACGRPPNATIAP